DAHVTLSPQIMGDPSLLGNQLAKRKALRPVLSLEQQRLCGFTMDGGPRLVRGVAGSGKTHVLAHWVAKTAKQLAGKPDARIWVAYANAALEHLLWQTIREAWHTREPCPKRPDDIIAVLHVKKILKDLLWQHRIPWTFNHDYEAASRAYAA